ncbi:MAG: 4-hydroxythreonine-4-phosphate dehydrogenase PdxA [Verrucomicrobia bacterium]|nr:4-hydroxythreonine-4-phosphate dehydrogenase PdxA [Verrucomicrobiota bacterium]
MTGWIGIALGDVTGIGPEVTLKALAAEAGADEARYLLLGDEARLLELNAQLGLGLPLHPSSQTVAGRFFIHNPCSEPIPPDLTPGSPAAALAALACLTDGAHRCLRLELDALVTAPLNKQAVIRAGQPFVGQTEFLSHLAGTEQTAMMLLGQDERGRWLRVALVSTHLPLRMVASQLSSARIGTVIERAAAACRDLGLSQARIAVCGLNPHAGEGGEFGTEERDVIVPAVQAARARNLDVVGPLAADSVFHFALRGDYDVVVAMYHDQGLGPLKLVAFDSGVNWTLGLPFVRTSPDHGTAYDLAGKNRANPSSMRAAIRLAKQLVRARA